MKIEDFLLSLLNNYKPSKAQQAQIEREWEEDVKPLLSILEDNEAQRKLLLSDDGNFQTIAWPAWDILMRKLDMMLPSFLSFWGILMLGYARATFMLGYRTRMAEELTFVVAKEDERRE